MENDAFYEYFAPKAEKAGMEKGMKQGMEKGMVTSVYNLMQSMKMTSEQAMKALLIPESKWSQYDEQIQKMMSSC